MLPRQSLALSRDVYIDAPQRQRRAVRRALDLAPVMDVDDLPIGANDAELMFVGIAMLEKAGSFRLDTQPVVGMNETYEGILFPWSLVGHAVKVDEPGRPDEQIFSDPPLVAATAADPVEGVYLPVARPLHETLPYGRRVGQFPVKNPSSVRNKAGNTTQMSRLILTTALPHDPS